MSSSANPQAPQSRARVVRDSLAVGVATGLYGVTFGVAGVASGLSVLQTCVLSLVMFTGASQFAFVGVVAAGGSPLSGAVTAMLLGSRNTFYGLQLTPLLGWRGWRRLGGAHLVIDESTAMSITRPTPDLARLGFVVTGVSVFALWNLTTLAGAVAGEQLGDPRTFGLDAAVGAAFLALLWPRLGGRTAQLIAAGAVLLTVALMPVLPAGLPVLATGIAALMVGPWLRSSPTPEAVP